MRVLVYEDNLLWSSRLVQSLRGLGHEAELRKAPTAESADVAIVNLASKTMPPEVLIPALSAIGVPVIGHAGHKEKELMALGQAAGCPILATNSELTFRLESLLAKVVKGE